MAKLSKKALAEFDAALDQLGGGVAPVRPPVKPVTPARAKKRAARPLAKKKAVARRKAGPKRKAGAKKR